MKNQNRIREAITSLKDKVAAMATDHPERAFTLGVIEALEWVCPGDRSEMEEARDAYFEAEQEWFGS